MWLISTMMRAFKKFSKDTKLLIIMSHIGGLCGGMTGFMLSLYFQTVGFSFENIGMVGGIGGLATTFTYLITPKANKIIGSKNLLYISSVLGVVGSIILLVKVDFILYILSSVIGGVANGLFSPAFVTVLAQKNSDTKYVYSVQTFSHQIGIAIGNMLGGILPTALMKAFSLQISAAFWWSILIATIIYSTQLILLIFTKIDAIPQEYGKKNSKIIRRFAITQALIGLGAGLVIPWIPLFFTNKYFLPQYPDSESAYSNALPLVSSVMTTVSFLMAFSFLLSPLFADKIGYVKTIVGTQSASVLFLVLLPFTPTFSLAAAFYIIRTILMMMSSPISTAFMMKIVDASERTRANSITMFAWNLAWSLSYSISGYIWNNTSIYIPFFLCATFYLSSFLLYYLFFAPEEYKSK